MKNIKLLVFIYILGCSHSVKRVPSQHFFKKCYQSLSEIFILSNPTNLASNKFELRIINTLTIQHEFTKTRSFNQPNYSTNALLDIAYHPFFWGKTTDEMISLLKSFGFEDLNYKSALSVQVFNQLISEPYLAQRTEIFTNYLSQHLLTKIRDENYANPKMFITKKNETIEQYLQALELDPFQIIKDIDLKKFKINRRELKQLHEDFSDLVLNNAEFVRDRRLLHYNRTSDKNLNVQMTYKELLPSTFENELSKPGLKIIDMGVGQGFAWVDYYKLFKNDQAAKVTGVTFNKPTDDMEEILNRSSKGSFKFITGSFVEDLPVNQLEKIKKAIY